MTSFVAKFAHAAPNATSTYPACTAAPLRTAHWLAWIDLYRDPILWPAVRKGAAVQAGYVLVAFGAAWANFATKDVTS